MPSIPQLAHPMSNADMRERRGMPLVRTPSSTSSQASRGGGVLHEAESLMVAANMANGIGEQGSVTCAITGNDMSIHAAHVLPHSYWSTARQHEWLFYAGASPNGNARYRGLDKFKYTEKNVVWLFSVLAGLMEPTKGVVILVPQLTNIITNAEQRLAKHEANELAFASFTSPELLVEWPHQVMASEKTASTFPYSLWIALPKEKLSLTFYLDALSIRKEGQSTTHGASTTLEIPVTYDPPLPTYNLCLDPIIASIVAWTTIRDRLLEGSLALADNNTFALLDYFLALCEAGTPSGWRSLTRPDGLPAARPPPPAAAKEDDRRRVYMAEDWAPPPSGLSKGSQKGSSSQALTSSSPSKRTHSSDLPGKVWKRSTRIVSGQQKALENKGDSKAEEAGGVGSSSAAQDGGQDPPSDPSSDPSSNHPSSDPSSNPSSEEPDTSLETKASSFASASLVKALPKVSAEEVDAAAERDEDEDEDVRTPDQRWSDACDWLESKRHHKRVGRLAKRLEDLEDDFVDEARRIIRLAFGERARRSGFSAAMRWLRGSDADALALDDKVRHIKANFLKVALPMVDAHADDPAPTHNVEAWLATRVA